MEAPQTCISCGGERLLLRGEIPAGHVFVGRALSEPLPGGRLYQCATCHLVFRYPRPSKKELDRLYAVGDMDNWRIPPGSRPDWMHTREWLERQENVLSILDVGCFDGSFLGFLGDRWERSGIVINDEAAARAQQKGISLVASDLSDLERIEESFDVVVSFDVIEHTHDPRRFLSSLLSVTADRGHIVLATGNTESVSWRIMGSRYRYCMLAEHLSFISPSWCSHTAAELGLSIEEIHTFSHSPRRPLRVRLGQLGRNLIYRFFPHAFRLLRRRGLGGVDVSLHPLLEDTPPIWTTAKDHFLVILTRDVR